MFVLDSSKKKPGQGRWNIRLTLPGIPAKTFCLRRSLRTSDLNEAIVKATALFTEYRARQSTAIPLTDLNWDGLYLLYDASLPGRPVVKEINERYLSKFFSRFADIRHITDTSIVSYFEWRMNFWNDWERPDNVVIGPGVQYNVAPTPHANTLKKDVNSIRSLLRFAKDRGHISVLPVIDIPPHIRKTLDTDIGRGAFDLKSYRSLTSHLRERCAVASGARGGDKRKCRPFDHLAIERLRFWVLLISNSALRPGEARTLKHMDITRVRGDRKDEREHDIWYTTILVRSKTSKVRKERLVMTHDYDTTYRRYERFLDMKRRYGLACGDNDFIFNSTRTPSKQYDIAVYFRKLLDEWDLTFDVDGNIRSSYSLRSFAISQAILRDVPLAVIAANSGTSAKMISKHYARFTSWTMRDHLVRRRISSRPTSPSVSMDDG